MRLLFVPVIALLAIFIACNKSSDFGKELVEGNNIPWFVTDSMPLEARTILGDSILTYYAPNLQRNLTSYKLGIMPDPNFGTLTAEVYAQMEVFSGSTDASPLANAQIDSVTWTITYDGDSTHQYGPFDRLLDFSVYRIQDDLNDSRYDSIYSSQQLNTFSEPVAELTGFLPRPYPKDSSKMKFYFNASFNQFLKSLPDSSFASTEKLQKAFEGLAIKAKNVTGSLLSLRLYSGANLLNIYYTVPGDTVQKVIALGATASGHNHNYFHHDLTGSKLASSLANPDQDSLLYVQGLVGPLVEITLPSISPDFGYILNQAELEVTVSSVNDFSLGLPNRLWLFQRNTNGSLISIKDAIYASSINSLELFGGLPEKFVKSDGTFEYKYRLRLTDQMRTMIKNQTNEKIYLGMASNGTDPGRAILTSTKAKYNPFKLRLIFSKIL